MNIKQVTAPTSRDALRKVKELLGPDAVILSNRAVDGGVEILALASEDIASLAPLGRPTLAPLPIAPERESAPVPVPPVMRRQRPDRHQADGLASALNQRRAPAVPAPSPARTPNDVALMMSEIRTMRGVLENQMAELAWETTARREPAKSAVLRELLAAGFSAGLARKIVEKLPAGGTLASAREWVHAVLERNLTTAGPEENMLDAGGIYALVGPTGVGKTTTVAKLAARYVMRHGPGRLALITTDGYRIGGHEQLRIYGKILGVMVHSVKDDGELAIALEELKGKHMVLIDTAGVGQRDQMVAEQLAMLTAAGGDLKRLVCLSATSTGETLSEVARAYRGTGLAGCIVTKVDEAATLGATLDAVVRHKLPLYYIASGQRVPEDLHIANPGYLVSRAMRPQRELESFALNDDELPLVMVPRMHAEPRPAAGR